MRSWSIFFKFYDVTTWLTNNYNTHIDEYLKKQRQSNNEIWSVNITYHKKHFSWKIIHEMWWRNYSQIFFKKSKLSISGDQ